MESKLMHPGMCICLNEVPFLVMQNGVAIEKKDNILFSVKDKARIELLTFDEVGKVKAWRVGNRLYPPFKDTRYFQDNKCREEAKYFIEWHHKAKKDLAKRSIPYTYRHLQSWPDDPHLLREYDEHTENKAFRTIPHSATFEKVWVCDRYSNGGFVEYDVNGSKGVVFVSDFVIELIISHDKGYISVDFDGELFHAISSKVDSIIDQTGKVLQEFLVGFNRVPNLNVCYKDKYLFVDNKMETNTMHRIVNAEEIILSPKHITLKVECTDGETYYFSEDMKELADILGKHRIESIKVPGVNECDSEFVVIYVYDDKDNLTKIYFLNLKQQSSTYIMTNQVDITKSDNEISFFVRDSVNSVKSYRITFKSVNNTVTIVTKEFTSEYDKSALCHYDWRHYGKGEFGTYEIRFKEGTPVYCSGKKIDGFRQNEIGDLVVYADHVCFVFDKELQFRFAEKCDDLILYKLKTKYVYAELVTQYFGSIGDHQCILKLLKLDGSPLYQWQKDCIY